MVGAPSYLHVRGVPLHPRDLGSHVDFGMRCPTDGSPYRWEFDRDREEIRVAMEGPLICDEPSVRLQAAIDGLGLAYVLEHEAVPHLRAGQLVRVLEDWTPAFPGCFLYYPIRRDMTAPLRAFIDFTRVTRESAQQPR